MAPKLPVLSGREVRKLLLSLGFKEIGQSGSHLKFERAEPPPFRTVIVAMHPEVTPGTLMSILRHAGIKRKDLELLLRRR